MTPSPKPTRILAIGDPGPTLDQITAALNSQPEFALVDAIHNVEKLSRDARAAEPDIILIDHHLGDQPTIDMLDDLTMQLPDVPQVAILQSNDSLSAQQAMLAGARAFIAQPFTQVNLLSVLRRVRDLEARRMQVKKTVAASAVDHQSLRTIAVYSPRGGVGCSTLAANLAIALHEKTGERVLLVDGKLSFGHLGMILNLRTRNSIADLIPHATSLDSALIGDVVSEHTSGIHVLLSPSSIQAAQGIRPQDLFNVMTALQRAFPYMVIDAGSSLNENTVTLLDVADRILLLTAPDLAALFDTSQFVQISRSLSYPPHKLLIVLNKANMPGAMRTKDIETALHHEVFAQIPDDGLKALRSLNRGIPLILKYPRSSASQAIKRLAVTLSGMNISDEAAVGANAQAEAWSGKKKLSPSRA